MSNLNFIETKANELLNSLPSLSFPIELTEAVLSLHAIDLHEEYLEDEVSGMLVIKENTKHIIINALHSKKRQRFTIAHELGHLFLHHNDGEDKLFIDKKTYHRASKNMSGTSYIEEREANLFAAYLLMPEQLLRNYISTQFGSNSTGFDEYDVSNIAEKCTVSDQAMMIRLKNLGYRVIDSY